MGALLLLPLGGLVAGALVLAVVVPRMVRLVRGSVRARFPATPRQTIDVAEPGEHVLFLEGPRRALLRPMVRVAGLELGGPRFTLRDPAAGEEVPVRGVALPTRTSSSSRARVSLARFHVDRPGAYELTAEGLPDDDRLQIVLGRPIAGALVLHILATVLGGLLLVGGLVGSVLTLALG